MRNALSRAITAIENAPLTLACFAAAFFALICVRLLVENALGLFEARTFFFFFFEFTHTFLFFLCAFLLLLPIVRFAGNVGFQKAANVLFSAFSSSSRRPSSIPSYSAAVISGASMNSTASSGSSGDISPSSAIRRTSASPTACGRRSSSSHSRSASMHSSDRAA